LETNKELEQSFRRAVLNSNNRLVELAGSAVAAFIASDQNPFNITKSQRKSFSDEMGLTAAIDEKARREAAEFDPCAHDPDVEAVAEIVAHPEGHRPFQMKSRLGKLVLLDGGVDSRPVEANDDVAGNVEHRNSALA
jgi:hypothetical protein